eukprot:1159202-Pelagomonas_calceolata.AAC.5
MFNSLGVAMRSTQDTHTQHGTHMFADTHLGRGKPKAAHETLHLSSCSEKPAIVFVLQTRHAYHHKISASQYAGAHIVSSKQAQREVGTVRAGTGKHSMTRVGMTLACPASTEGGRHPEGRHRQSQHDRVSMTLACPASTEGGRHPEGRHRQSQRGRQV